MPFKPPIITCQGVTKNGKPCKRPPRRGFLYCKEHLIIESAPLGVDVEIARQVQAHQESVRVRPTAEVLNPATGEIVTLGEASDSGLHGLLRDLALFTEALHAARMMVENEVHLRMDQRARWTLHTDYGDLVGSSPTKIRVIAEPIKLREALLELGLPEATVDEAIERVVPPVQYKPRARGLAALSKVDAPREVIEHYTRWIDKEHRKVTLKTKVS